jgi:hypothetical protein
MRTIAEIYPENIRALANEFPSIVAMSHHFSKCTEMDKALGFHGAVNKWFTKAGNKPSTASEAAAGLWLKANRLDLGAPQKAPEAALPAPVEDDAATFMLVVPRAKSEKVMRVLSMLGVESIEI